MQNENIKLVDSKVLFEDKSRSVKILHNGSVYILRITKENKLILTK
jgi:hemin uptake protein HemP